MEVDQTNLLETNKTPEILIFTEKVSCAFQCYLEFLPILP